MECHKCGVCCTEISISSINKPAGVRCDALTGAGLCSLFGKPGRPAVCSSFQAEPAVCGSNASDATRLIRWLEKETAPAQKV